MLNPVALPTDHQRRPGPSVPAGARRVGGLPAEARGAGAGCPTITDVLAAVDVLELAAMSHAEAQRRDDPGHAVVTKIDLLKARNQVQSLLYAMQADRAGVRQAVRESIDVLQRRGSTLIARRLSECADAIARNEIKRDPCLRDLLVEAADSLDNLGRTKLAKLLRALA